MKTSRTLFTAFIISVSLMGQAQNNKIELIDNFIKQLLNEVQEVPSLAITIIKDGKPFYTKSYGYSEVETKTKATAATAYYIASATKPFVGLLAAQLEEEGVLDLNQSISTYAPIKNFKDKSIFEGVTIADLLSHTSGIKNTILAYQFSGIGQYTRKQLIKILEEKTSSRFNNKSYRYDNLGYNVFDLILSEEFNLNWKDLLQQKIFNPLDMNHSSAYLSKAKINKWNIAKPYTSVNDTQLPTLALTQKNDATFQAAGGIITSIQDAQNWLLMQMNEGKFRGQQIVSKEVLSNSRLQLTKTKGSGDIFKNIGYGLGWNTAQYNERDAVYHFGSFDGFFSHLSFLPEDNIGIAIFSNESYFGDNVSNLIAAFSYDVLLDAVTSLENYEKKVNAVNERVDYIQKAYANDRASRASRKWHLKHEFKKYVGTYENEFLGELIITQKDNQLIASLGISKAIATPSLNDDSIRIEFNDGRGQEILFIANKKKVIAAVSGTSVFLKK